MPAVTVSNYNRDVNLFAFYVLLLLYVLRETWPVTKLGKEL
jgi:hypothetical protein